MGQVAEKSEHAVPDCSAEECENRKGQKFHACNTSRNRNQLSNDCNEAAYESGNGTMFAEVVFGFLHFTCIEKQEVSEAAVGKLVDDGAAQELCQVVVDECSDECSKACKCYNQGDVQIGVWLQSFVGGGGHHQFRRKGNEGTFDSHQKGYGSVVQVGVVPVDNEVVNHKVQYRK